MVITSKKYKNGLTLVYEKNKSQNTSLHILIKTGSVNEPIHLNGVSHLLEHMLFKGTKKIRDSIKISLPFDIVGADFNAYTSQEVTCYLTKCNSDNINKLLKIFYDMVFNSTLLSKEIKKEKHVVIEELLKRRDNPRILISEYIYSSLFKGGNLEHSVGGDSQTVLQYKRKDIVDYYKYFYKPDNIVVSVCSNLPFSTIDKYIKATFGKHKNKSTKNCKKYLADYVVKYNRTRLLCINHNLKQVHISIGFRTCNIDDPDYYILNILSVILSGNMSSLLFIKLREEAGISYSSSTDVTSFQKNGCFIIETAVNPNKVVNSNKKGAVSIIVAVLEKLLRKGVTSKQLLNAKGYLKGQMSLNIEDISSISGYNGYNYLFDSEDKNISLKDLYKKRYSVISKQQINSVLRKYFRSDNMYCCFLGKNVKKLKRKIAGELSSFN